MNSKKIYVAVLNEGQINEKLCSVLEKMPLQSKYEVWRANPSDKPIANNRNKIVQEFLATDCDYLLMIDDDIVPPDNILNLADFQKDVISPICFAFQQNMVAPLIMRMEPEGTYTVANYKGYEGLVETDAVGAGCLMVARRVLENPEMKAPFEDIFDADGVRKYGQDLAFCQKAKKLGYGVFCHLDYACDHFVVMNLKKIYSSFIK